MAEQLRREIVQHLPSLRRFAYSLVGSRADAEDLAQAAVERALRAEDRWREGTRLDSWLFRIAQNLFRDERRSRRNFAEFSEALELEGTDGREVVSTRAELRDVLRAFQELPADQQAVLSLVVLASATYDEAAAALNVPRGTVMSRLARARANLVAKLAEGTS